MGPFPHDAPVAQISDQNPAGTDGFGFVEYAHPNPAELHALFKTMGFMPVAKHRRKAITLYRQGDVNYLVNEEPGSHATKFAAAHGPCASSMAFRVVDAKLAYERAIANGAELRACGLQFMPSPPPTYYEKVEERVPGSREDVARLEKNGILIDGEGAIALGAKEGTMTKVLLQIFSANAIGPIFFEFIQRKGDEGFGEGNFRALFVSIEEDQLRRGVLKPAKAS